MAVNVRRHPPNGAQAHPVHEHVHDVVEHRVRNPEQAVSQHKTQGQRQLHPNAQRVDQRAVDKGQADDKNLVGHQQHRHQRQQSGAALSRVFGPDDLFHQPQQVAQLGL